MCVTTDEKRDYSSVQCEKHERGSSSSGDGSVARTSESGIFFLIFTYFFTFFVSPSSMFWSCARVFLFPLRYVHGKITSSLTRALYSCVCVLAASNDGVTTMAMMTMIAEVNGKIWREQQKAKKKIMHTCTTSTCDRARVCVSCFTLLATGRETHH